MAFSSHFFAFFSLSYSFFTLFFRFLIPFFSLFFRFLIPFFSLSYSFFSSTSCRFAEDSTAAIVPNSLDEERHINKIPVTMMLRVSGGTGTECNSSPSPSGALFPSLVQLPWPSLTGPPPLAALVLKRRCYFSVPTQVSPLGFALGALWTLPWKPWRCRLLTHCKPWNTGKV